MKTTPERLGVPPELSYFDGIIQFKESRKPVFRRIVDRKFDPVQRKFVDTLKSFDVYSKVSSSPAGMNKREGLNFLSDMIHGQDFEVVNENLLQRERKEFTIQVGPQAGETFWTMSQQIVINQAGATWTFGSVFKNAQLDGSPSEGWNWFEVENTINHHLVRRAGGVTTTTIKTHRFVKNEKFTKDQLEELGYTDKYLCSLAEMNYTLAKPDDRYLINVATDLEEIGERVYWPNVYFNGKDDNSFDFKKLIPHYAATTPDFVVRLRAYNDSTNADYPEPNYSGMGNFGKCLDIAFENEQVKPVRIEFGDNFSFENNEEEVVITFDNQGTRAAIGMCVEYKPLDGKKTDNEIYMDVRTGEVFHDIFKL